MAKLNDKPSKLHKLKAGIFAIRILFMLYDFFFLYGGENIEHFVAVPQNP